MARQSDLRYTFAPLASDAQFEVIDFKLKEWLSRPFRLKLTLSSHDPEIDFSGLLDSRALFTLWRGETAVRHVHGLISSITAGDRGFRRTRYTVVVEPHISRLGLSSNWRIFQSRTAPQIIDQVLAEHQVFDREQIITNAHEPREYCVQAGETDLAFIARLAAEEGLLYTFLHSESGHRLIHTDRISCLGMIGAEDDRSLIYAGRAGGDQTRPAFSSFEYTERVRPAAQRLRDYSFKHPRYHQQHLYESLDLERQASTYVRYDYPGRYKQEGVGKAFTETRLLALRNDARTAIATGDDARLRPGPGFDLAEHPRESFNGCWRAVKIVHEGKQYNSQEEDAAGAPSGTTYTQTAMLVDGLSHWKPSLLPRPQIDGTQTATVTGPPGEEIYCDEWGRVKVSFPWDLEGQQDDKSSCWIRVSQGSAGTFWGAMSIPRVGQEVVIGFLDGDPDQPIILGRTYRAENLPPYSLPKHKTRMTIKSQTHKGEGSNELRFEDERGQQELYLHAEKDQNTVVKNHQTLNVGFDRAKEVGQDESITVGRNHLCVDRGNDRLKVGGSRHDLVSAEYELEVGSSLRLKCGKTVIELRADGELNITCERFNITGAQAGQINTPTGALDLNIDGGSASIGPDGRSASALFTDVDSHFQPRKPH